MKIALMIFVLASLALTSCTPELPPDDTTFCPAVYEPVCGQPPMPECPPGMACSQVMPNPETYSNECEMSKAGAVLLYEGECRSNDTSDIIFCTPEQKANQMCTREYMPVCGNDGVTYGNKCEACSAQVDSYTIGECNQMVE